MSGLAVGSGIKMSKVNTISVRNKVIFLLIFYILFGVIYNSFLELKSGVVSVTVIILSSFMPATLTGNIFRELTSQNDGISASHSIYSADLAGSAFGFIFISGFAVPVLGIQVSVFLLAVLIFVGILFGAIRNI
jgi:hypothetical protein